MKKIILLLVFSSLFAKKVETKEEINITQASNVLVYTNLFWAPCKEAKLLLQSRGIDYDTKLLTFSKKNITQMAKLTGGKTSVPQIFVDDIYFGGLLELKDYYKEN